MIVIMSEDLHALLVALPRRDFMFEAGQSVFLQGEPVRKIFFIETGIIHLTRYQASGAAIVLQRAGPGAIIAEASQHSDKYHCTGAAITKSTGWSISKRELLERLSRDPKLALAFIGRLADELQYARFHAEVLSMKTVTDRLDAWINWRGALSAKGEWIRVAAALGVSPEALYREFAKRKKQR